VTPCWLRCSSISSLARFSWVEAGTTSEPTGRAGHDGHDALCPWCGGRGRLGRGR
jgi:hypothetical protein